MTISITNQSTTVSIQKALLVNTGLVSKLNAVSIQHPHTIMNGIKAAIIYRFTIVLALDSEMNIV